MEAAGPRPLASLHGLTAEGRQALSHCWRFGKGYWLIFRVADLADASSLSKAAFFAFSRMCE